MWEYKIAMFSAYRDIYWCDCPPILLVGHLSRGYHGDERYDHSTKIGFTVKLCDGREVCEIIQKGVRGLQCE